MMNNLFADIQKVLPPGGTPRRVLYQGPPGSPTGTLYEELGKVAIMADQDIVGKVAIVPSQQAGGSRPGSSRKSAFFRSPAEEYRVSKDGTRTVTGPQVLGSISHSGSGKDTHQAPRFGSGGNSG